jgi:uncharacterized membrane protein YeiB
MVMVHIGPTDAGGLGGQLYALSHGRAALLFVLLAGAGVALLDRGRSTGLTPVRLLWRGAVLLPAGLALQELDHGVLVILQDYALLFVVALGLRLLGDRWLLGLALVAFALGPAAHVALEHTRPELAFGAATAWSDPPLEVARGLVATGPYPLITWIAPFALGMWVGRRELADARVVVRFFVGGAVVGLLALWAGTALHEAVPADAPGWWALATDPEPHSQSPVWLASSSAIAVALLATSLAAAAAAPRALAPLVAFGQLALTVYVGHLLLIAAFEDVARTGEVGGAALRVLGFTVVTALLTLAWRAAFRRGPLEVVLNLPAAILGGRGRPTAVAGPGAPAGPSR